MRAIDTLRTALKGIIEEEGLAWPVKTVIEPPRDPKHGDLSVNSAMLLAKEAKAKGASRFCMGAAWRGPKEKELEVVTQMIREVKALGMETCVTLGMLKDGQAE